MAESFQTAQAQEMTTLVQDGVPKELQAGKRRQIGLGRERLKDHLGTERIVQSIGTKAASIERA